jgi:hypothetical protein
MEYLKIENGIIVEHIAGEPPDDSYTPINCEFWGSVGEPVDWYDENWNRHDDKYLFESGIRQIPEGFKLSDDKTRLIDMDYEEKVIAGILPVPQGHKIKDGMLIGKPIREMYDDGEISTEKYEKFRRDERNRLLAETDKYLLLDFPISDEDREIVKNYRQQLRDVTEDKNWLNVEFPQLKINFNKTK